HLRPRLRLHHGFCTTRPQPPTPPLFPYTTLFRSTGATSTVTTGVVSSSFFPRQPTTSAAVSMMPTHRELPTAFREKARDIVISKDRKSTRLNSSHVSTSYAVFCSKKKTLRRACAS